MCGITGFIDTTGKSDGSILNRMTDTLVHRGPDDRGVHLDQQDSVSIGLGHRRLSILDLSPAGHQPMEGWGRRIVFNGEVYNFREIRSDLEGMGYRFASDSDTEVILAAFDAWGDSAVDRFIGMFTFALYDRGNGTISLYRDRAGVKPLFYSWDGRLFIFGSELKALFAHPGFSRTIDTDALRQYVQLGYVGGEHSIIAGCSKVAPGSCVTFSIQRRELEHRQYWSVAGAYNRPRTSMDETEALEQLDTLCRSAFSYRMVSDVPVGMFLSGGYDSSTVAALLQAEISAPLKTFTIGFHEKGYDEAGWAKKVAAHLGTDHTEYYCTQKEAADIIPALPEIFDEPFGDSSAIPTILVSRLARQSVTVSLSADAGDELFAGYGKHPLTMRYHRMFRSIPGGLRRNAAAFLDSGAMDRVPVLSGSYNYTTRLRKVADLLRAGSAGRTLEVISSDFSDRQLKELFRSEPSLPPTASRFLNDADLDPEVNDLLSTILAVDYQTYLPDDILVKVDRAAMSVSLEGREPLLDHRLLEFAAALPSSMKMRKGPDGSLIQKYLLKQLAHRYIPRELLDRPKMGFGVPIVHWFRDELKDYFLTYLDEERLKREGFFRPEPIIRLRDRYLAGHRENVQKLWYLLMFEMWYERWS